MMRRFVFYMPFEKQRKRFVFYSSKLVKSALNIFISKDAGFLLSGFLALPNFFSVLTF